MIRSYRGNRVTCLYSHIIKAVIMKLHYQADVWFARLKVDAGVLRKKDLKNLWPIIEYGLVLMGIAFLL